MAAEGERETAQLVGLYRKELDIAKAGKRKLRKELSDHFGGNKLFFEQVELFKKKRGGSADGTEPFSQESLLGDYIDYEMAVVDNTKLRDEAIRKLNKFSAAGKENQN